MINSKKVAIIISLILLCIVTSSALAFTFHTSSDIYPTLPARWEVSNTELSLDQITIDDNGIAYSMLSKQGFVDIVDFDNEIELISGEIIKSENDNLIKICQESLNGEVSVIQRLERYEDRLSWKVSLKNNIQRDVKLEIALKLPVQVTNEFNYWDGYEVHSLSEGIIKRDKIVNTFPLSYLYNDNVGLAVGLAPDTLISQLENGIDEQGNLYYSTKVAIVPTVETEVEFILFAVSPHFGHLDAINGYYRRFPTYFKPSPKADPRLTSMGTGASYYSRYENPRDIKRRATMLNSFNSTWDWGYVPFKRCGDFYGKEDLWDWEMTDAEAKRLAEVAPGRRLDLYDLNNFHEQRKVLFKNADLKENCNLAFYMINWIEKNYAEEKGWLDYVYPYNGTPIYNNWVTGYSPEYHIYPWASPFETIVKTDFPLLLEELNTNSIAFDNFFNSAPYRNELDYPIEGWSYDLRGKYISTAIGIRHFVDYVKKFEKNGFEIGIIGNTLFKENSNHQEFTSTFYADAFITEARFFDELAKGNKDAFESFFKNRYFAGHKPLYLWDHFYKFDIGEYVDWEALTPEEIRILYQTILKEIVQASYQHGFIPITNAIVGNELIIREMPTLLDIQMRGFEPVSAAKGNESLLRQRYGLGLNSAIVISNPTSESIMTEEQIDNRYLSDYEVVPANYFGKPLELTLIQEQTTFNASIDPVENLIVVFPLGIKVEDGENRLTGVSSGQIDIDKKEYNFKLESNKAIEVNLLPAISEAWRVDELLVNNFKIAYPYKTSLINGTNMIKIVYKSNVFKASENELLGFEYCNAKIIVANGADEREKAAAEMIQGYFEYNEKEVIPISEGSNLEPLKHTIKFEKSTDFSETGIYISDNGRLLTIKGQNSFDIQQKVWKLLGVLNKKYPYLGELSFTKTQTRDMMEKAGLLGKPAFIIEDANSASVIASKETSKQLSVDNLSLPSISIKRMDQAPVMDGKLNDDIWQKATVVDSFTLLKSKGKPTQKTVAKLFYTSDALYVGFICYEEYMKDIFAFITEHDGPVWNDDDVELFLAPGVDKKATSIYPYYQFIVNSIGTRWEAYNKNVDYNGEWSAVTYEGENFWSVEIEIPFDQLKSSDSKIWRFNLARGEKPNGEWSTWAPMKGLLDQPSLFGVLYLE